MQTCNTIQGLYVHVVQTTAQPYQNGTNGGARFGRSIGTYGVRSGQRCPSVSICNLARVMRDKDRSQYLQQGNMLYLCLPLIFQRVGIPHVAPWSLHVDLCCEIEWESMYGVHSAQLLQVRMCDVETMSLVGYKIGYIVNFVSNPDCHLDSKWRSCNRPSWSIVMIGYVVANRLRYGEMEGVIRLIVTSHLKGAWYD